MNKYINTAKEREKETLRKSGKPIWGVPVVALPETGHEGSILINT